MKIRRTLFAVFLTVSSSQASLFAENGAAALKPTQENSKLSGQASFRDTDEGLKISVEVSNASPGNHAIHIH